MSLLIALTLMASPAPQQATPLFLTRGQTRSIVIQYGRAKHWSLKGVLLLSLGGDWHPDGAEIVLDGLKSKDPHLRAYALEAMLATDEDALPVVATKPIVEHLVKKSIKDKNELYRARALELFAAIFPDAEWPDEEGPDARAAAKHWRAVGDGYTPAKWESPDEVKNTKTSATPFVDRVLVLNEGGLQLCLCIDTTSSMQPTIDAAAVALQDIATLLSGMASSCEIGLVEYRDHNPYPNSATQYAAAGRVTKLEKKVDKVFKRLSRLEAIGGGDAPERVELGLEIALDEEMGWEREANKLIVVIGDAPPHPGEAHEMAVELARQAHEKPFGREPSLIAPEEIKKGRSRAKRDIVRPWVVSTIGVGQGGVPGQTEGAFKAIAEAGGGAYARLILPKDGNGESELSNEASQQILRNVLIQTFGPKHERRVGQFIDVFFAYDDEEYWKKRK